MTRSRILLVEDDQFHRRALVATLRGHGPVVDTAEDGDEALRLLSGGFGPISSCSISSCPR